MRSTYCATAWDPTSVVSPCQPVIDASATGLRSVRHARTGRATSREPAVIRGAVALSRQRPRPGKSCRAHRRDGARRPDYGSTSARCRHSAAGHTGPTTDRESPRRSTHRATEAAPTTRASRAPPSIADSARRQSRAPRWMEFQSVSPVILPPDHSMLTGRRSQCRKTAVSCGGAAAMTPNAAVHTAGFCASTGT
jgi:hypothetical protein